MRTNIIGRNYKVSDRLEALIDKKFAKLDKYFSDDITANVMILEEKGRYKMEATISAQKHIFRAEVLADDPYDGVDKVVDKLSNQMSKFKTKLQKKHKEHKEFKFEELPEVEDEQEEIKVVKRKRFELTPMTADDAVVQMEQLGHDFYVFTDLETDKVCVAYKRHDGDYGILETE